MRLIEWLWSIATGLMPDTTGKPQGSTRPCLLSHSSPANASSALPLRFFACSLVFVYLLVFLPSVFCFLAVFTSFCKNKMNNRHDKKFRTENVTFEFHIFLLSFMRNRFKKRGKKKLFAKGGELCSVESKQRDFYLVFGAETAEN